MSRNVWIIAVIIFGISLGGLYLSNIPVVILEDEVLTAVLKQMCRLMKMR